MTLVERLSWLADWCSPPIIEGEDAEPYLRAEQTAIEAANRIRVLEEASRRVVTFANQSGFSPSVTQRVVDELSRVLDDPQNPSKDKPEGETK